MNCGVATNVKQNANLPMNRFYVSDLDQLLTRRDYRRPPDATSPPKPIVVTLALAATVLLMAGYVVLLS